MLIGAFCIGIGVLEGCARYQVFTTGNEQVVIGEGRAGQDG